MTTARFWTMHRGDYVKLALRPGQSITLSEGGPTDEGWSRRDDTFTHEGDRVVREWEEDGVDCDGRLRAGGVLVCPVAELRSHVGCDDAPGLFPAWREGDRWQRDYAAEAAGY